MSSNERKGLDRRAFMASSVVAVTATAAATANAQVSTPGATLTGDVIDGKQVVSALDVNALEPGKKHMFYFQGVETPAGKHWYVSVTVAKGRTPGKRLTLTSGVHGDEMSSIRTVQQIMDALDPEQMSGSVMGVFDIASPALVGMQRRWPDQGRGAGLVDMNREWPGNENGASAASRQAGLLFNHLLKPNSDAAIDFHTGTTGLECGAFIIGDRTLPAVKEMIALYPVEQVWDNPAYPGVLHNAFVDAGIPSFCPEIGAARILNPAMIAQFVEGTLNVAKHLGIVGGAMGKTAKDMNTFIGNSAYPVIATHGGYIEHLVKIYDNVTAGQKVIIQRNAFGETVAEYTSAVDGQVGAIRSDTSSEPGNVLGFILFPHAPSEGEGGYPE